MAQVDNSLLKPSPKAAATPLSYNNENPELLVPEEDEPEQPPQPPPAKKKRSQPGMPDPEAEVVALSPGTLMATNRFVCEICGKGFQRDQNLQLHRRGHNLPWKLRQRGPKEAARKRVYVCPEAGCVHHDPRRALGDLTGIKKHFCRKHGEKKWKCERCSKKYAVLSDWKAHLKTCGTREYKCDCGTIFSRRDSFVTHRAFCDALAQESAKVQVQALKVGLPPLGTGTSSAVLLSPGLSINQSSSDMQVNTVGVTTSLNTACCSTSSTSNNCNNNDNGTENNSLNIVCDHTMFAPLSQSSFPSTYSATAEPPPALSLSPLYQYPVNSSSPPLFPMQAPAMSATALLQKAAQMGASSSGSSLLCGFGLSVSSPPPPPSSHHPKDDKCVKLENDFTGSGQMIGDESGFFGSKPMTLDLLGLGLSPLDVAVAFRAGSDSGLWEGQASQRKHNEPVP